jgi:ATP-dependent helicase HrpA
MSDAPTDGTVPQRDMPRERRDAVHRALLAGLLGNVGVKKDKGEFQGARGKKFHVFPGSALFKRHPEWVMAAELVETTRLYARTVGPARADWVERLAEHLVQRTYSDEHWNRERARVEAYERVTLQGLVLVARRVIDYGPMEPALSRAIFIHQALVKGEYRTAAPFFAHNQRLVEQVRLIEAKARRRDVLVDEEARVRFFDARVPRRVYDGHEFEKWRRQAEKHNERLLYMSRSDLMLHGAEGVTAELFPDSLTVEGVKVALEYRFDPGHAADGITTVVPLAALNQLPAEPFEWLVPGYLTEKIVALIRSMPKPLRVQFIPAPEVAQAAAAALGFGRGSLLDALALVLGKRSGAQVARTAFEVETLPDHLRMNFRVTDAAGKTVAAGRDLEEIRRKLGVKARETFSSMPPTEFHRDKITRWDFGDLPEHVELRRMGMTLLGYPSLVDGGASASVRVLDAPAAARAAMRGGLRRLFMIQVGEELKYLSRKLPGIEQMSLHYAALGSYEELKRDLLTAAADLALFGDEDDEAANRIRTRDAFAARAQEGWKRLTQSANEVSAAATEALVLRHQLHQRLAEDFPPLLLPAGRDLRDQLARLVPPRFLVRTPTVWLKHLPRFLKGMQIRVQRLFNAGLARDAAASAELAPLWKQYLQRELNHRSRGLNDPALEQFRWMLEELRVSLFAQELKTSVPVSVKRLEALWEQVAP